MDKIKVKHFLQTYITRLDMQTTGTTNPSGEAARQTKLIVDILSKLSSEDEITHYKNTILDSKGVVIIDFDKSQ